MEDIRTRLLQESDQYAEMMLWNNNYDESDFEDSFSEVSSGYESTGSSIDSQSVSPEESRVCPLRPMTARIEETQFQSVQPLCNSLELILSMSDFCDVIFLVGPERIPVRAVKAILACRSRKLFELIIKHQNLENEELNNQKKRKTNKTNKNVPRRGDNKLVIPVKKYDCRVFEDLIRFIHCGAVTITDENVAGLFCGASQFELEDLKKACLNYILGRVQERHFTTMLSSIRKYSYHKASSLLFDMVHDAQKERIKKYREISV